ncbi:MAG: Asp23/Gls24 family envelope stress response protein [Bavariicoccus seileri]|uniref:Asp23/Gls24 family envelope stress response protein n=1 Tax=Bavariicoccus seileri TaxID=549685 RepID=A0A3D4S3N5_9ENTE|nr:Asp23/Gls24 family envelope stress response protein [Bavariicoccus seileri]HCS93444.1 Asp23/Gls24 family envelope stress response protein [Bavariicoccus seileri]
MAVKIETNNGIIDLDNDVIATVVGVAATDNYGVIGMASKKQIRDNLIEILKKENYSRGVVISQDGDNVVVDVYIIVAYGTKISEICRNVQQQVKYNLETLLGIAAEQVNIHVQGVRLLEQ